MQAGGCGYWVWCDPPIPSAFIREVLVDLRDVTKALRNENRELNKAVEEHKGDIIALRAAMEALSKEEKERNEEAQKKVRSLQNKNKRCLLKILGAFLVIMVAVGWKLM